MEDRQFTQVFVAEASTVAKRALLERWLLDEFGPTGAELIPLGTPCCRPNRG